MPHITLEEHLPGITVLLEYGKCNSTPIRTLTQFLRVLPALTEGKCQLVAMIVFARQCAAYIIRAYFL